jgi:phosphatidylglycerophosphate synthase
MSSRGRWLTRANGLTLLRLLAAPALVLAVAADASGLGAAIFALAVATDFADGYVARRFDEASPRGGLVDHAADATFVTAGTGALAWAGVLPAALPPLIAIAFLQYAADSRLMASRGLRPSSLGRWNGIAYYVIVAIPLVRDALALGWPGAMMLETLAWLLVGTTVASIADRLRVVLRSRPASKASGS